MSASSSAGSPVGALPKEEPAQRERPNGVREALLEAQAASVGLPLTRVEIPYPCPNEVYEQAMVDALAAAAARGVTRVVFGDLFLADIRAYREAQLARAGLTGVFPLWGRDTASLAREMIAAGVDARLVCVGPSRLDRSFAGRPFDRALLEALPAGVDPCGENGEFHTFVADGPVARAGGRRARDLARSADRVGALSCWPVLPPRASGHRRPRAPRPRLAARQSERRIGIAGAGEESGRPIVPRPPYPRLRAADGS
jgi:uncharacterized protein (TIGR00290 family)